MLQSIKRLVREIPIANAAAQRVSRRVVLRRRMPARYGGDIVYISPSSAVTLWRPDLEKFDKALFNWASEFVTEGDVVWDVGANLGFFTFAASSLAGPAGYVVAIEADTLLVDLMRRSVLHASIRRAPVDILPAAISSSVDLAKLNIAKRGRVRNYLEGVEGSKTTGGVQQTQSVLTVTLDWLLERLSTPQVVKIDVEGAEAKVLAGASKILAEAQPIIVCEVIDSNRKTVTDLLHSFGYELFDLDVKAEAREPLPLAVFNTLAYPPSRR